MNAAADFWAGTGSRPVVVGSPAGVHRRGFDRIVLALLTLGFFYNTYRYPFQINSSGTSPTYADTPAWLSLGKYLLIAAVLALAILLRIGQGRSVALARPLHLLGYLFLAAMPVVAGLVTAHPDYVIVGFFFLVPVVVQFFSGYRLDFRTINRYLAGVVVLAIVVELLQLVLFLLLGRLPALAYEDSISVRFGSFLDDPNGFGILLCWFVPFCLFFFRGAIRATVLGLLFVTLILTQSLTAVVSFGVVGVIIGVLIVTTRPRLAFPVLVGATIVSVGIGWLAYTFRRELVAIYDLFMLTKEGSLAAHAGSLGAIGELRLLNLAGLEPDVDLWVETGYLNLLGHYGVAYVALLVLLGGWAIVYYAARIIDTTVPADIRTFAAGAVGLLIAFLLGNLNLPLVEVFPINLFAALLMGLASARILDSSRLAEPHRVSTRLA